MVLDPLVAGLVLFAAFLHASWNAVVKSGADRVTSMALVMLAGTPFGFALLPFAGPLGPDAWPWLLASMVVHGFYYVCLIQAYRFGDLSQVYPIARGLGPLIVAATSGFVFGEVLSTREFTGAAVASLGIFTLAFAGRGFGPEARHAIGFAVLTGLTIAAYTMVDGRGVRAAHDPLAYIAWLNIVESPWVAFYAIYARGLGFFRTARREVVRGLSGGFIACIAYGIAIWAFTRGGAAHVAALRESSVIFAAGMGAVLLGESFGPRRILAACLVAVGLILMNWRG